MRFTEYWKMNTEHFSLRASPTEDHEISFEAIEHCDARQMAPAFKSQALEKAEARFIVTKNEAQQCGHMKRRRVSDRSLNQFATQAPAPVLF